jgi:hypothetical protein
MLVKEWILHHNPSDQGLRASVERDEIQKRSMEEEGLRVATGI